jgi:hypothetical protein
LLCCPYVQLPPILPKWQGQPAYYQSTDPSDGGRAMRILLFAALAALSFTATMTYEPADANAVVCYRGIYRAGCVGAYGGVVVRRPYWRRWYGPGRFYVY